MKYVAALLWAVSLVAIAAAGPAPEPYAWNLPEGFPLPRVPVDNPMTAAKVELGRHLFYDTRLSANGTQSCGTCHEQARAFTDGKARAVGSTGEMHSRGAMSLVNIAYAGSLTWIDQSLSRLEDQTLVPMYGDHPVELGLPRSDNALIERLRRERRYQPLFANAFPADRDPFTPGNVVKAISSFERTIISARSPYDRYHTDRVADAISPAARRGETLFFSQPFTCFRCHSGFAMAGATDFEGRERNAEGGIEFHNTGVSSLPETFKAPTLRNIAVTGPYMHDGSMATLEEVLDHYAAGGRHADNPAKSRSIRGFTLTADQRAGFLAFLNSLTDDALLHDPRFADPWSKH